MRYPVKIKGTELTPLELQNSYRIIQERLNKCKVLFGDFRESSQSVVSAGEFASVNSIDFSVTNISIGEGHLIFNVNILNEAIKLKHEEMIVIPGYLCDAVKGSKEFARIIIAPIANYENVTKSIR